MTDQPESLRDAIAPLVARSEATGERIDSLLSDLNDHLAKPIGGSVEPKRSVSLAEFVAARLDERWHQATRNFGGARWDAKHATSAVGRVSSSEALQAAEREIRVIEVQRRTLARHKSCGYGTGYCDDGGHGWDDGPGYGCAELADLAAPDHEHPDFNPAWKADS